MADRRVQPEAHTDIAALSAAVVAVVISMLVLPDEYNLLNLAVSVVIILIIAAYVWANARTWLQTIALSSVIGLSAIPGIGFIDEAARSNSNLAEWIAFTIPLSTKEQTTPANGAHQTRVPDGDVTIASIAIFLVAAVGDRINQRWLVRR